MRRVPAPGADTTAAHLDTVIEGIENRELAHTPGRSSASQALNAGAVLATPAEVESAIASLPYWHHSIELAPGIVTPGASDCATLWSRLKLPEDMTGWRVLDAGCSDGYFSFRCEKAGAEVVAIDHLTPEKNGFALAKRLLGSTVEFHHCNVYELTPERFGLFDLVLFLGVLYHLRSPLLGLDRIRSVCRGLLWVETLCIDSALTSSEGPLPSLAEIHPKLPHVPLAQFFPRDSMAGHYTNYWGPNSACVRAMLEEARFEVLSSEVYGDRAIFRARATQDPLMEHLSSIESGLAWVTVREVLERRSSDGTARQPAVHEAKESD